MSIQSSIRKEIEIKLDLQSFTNYLKLIGCLGQIDRRNRHLNGFFDTKDRRLSELGWAFRVRAEDNRGLVTAKGKNITDGLAAVREEIEVDISRGKALEILRLGNDVLELDVPPTAFIRELVEHAKLYKILSFECNREIKSFRLGDKNRIFEVDTTNFTDGTVDYELEVEIDDPKEIEIVGGDLQSLFASLDIPFIPQKQSKFARALKIEEKE